MLTFINVFNLTLFVLFTVLYGYQVVYALVSLFHKDTPAPQAKRLHKYAVIIAARNESAVIGGLLDSILRQNYPSELLDTVVVADNCTDNTAQVARQAGAIVYERHNTAQVGKGYALDYVFKLLAQDHGPDAYEGFFVFDADNLLDENYVAEMNKLFDKGYRVLTSYRNSKNYDSNWISAGYSLWFLREAKYLNNPRMLLHTSCAISGTGFFLCNDIVKANNGWKHHLLTEDIEFSIDSVIHGEKIGYCSTAKIYDEQPCTWSQSWNQRLRWSKGFYQVFGKYGRQLASGFLRGRSFGCYDMFMTIAPALFITLASILMNGTFLICGLLGVEFSPHMMSATANAIAASVCNFYLVLFAFGLLTTLTEWKQIHAAPLKKIFYTFTFPLFIFTYVPISIVALFRKIEWKPITHSICKSLEDVRS